MTVAVAKAFVPHAKNGWEFTLDVIGCDYERVVAKVAQGHLPPSAPAGGDREDRGYFRQRGASAEDRSDERCNPA